MNPVLHSLLPAFSMALLLLGGLAPLNNRWLPPLATATLLECVAFLVPMAVFGVIQRRLGTPLRMRLRLAPPRFWPLTFFVAGAVSLLSFFLNYLMALATGGALLEGTTYDAVSRFGGAPGWLLVLALALLPALVEELFFRGGAALRPGKMGARGGDPGFFPLFCPGPWQRRQLFGPSGGRPSVRLPDCNHRFSLARCGGSPVQ